jgi:hypothetical protein
MCNFWQDNHQVCHDELAVAFAGQVGERETAGTNPMNQIRPEFTKLLKWPNIN